MDIVLEGEKFLVFQVRVIVFGVKIAVIIIGDIIVSVLESILGMSIIF